MAALNDDASRVLVSHGASAAGTLLNDAWILDLSVGSNQQVQQLHVSWYPIIVQHTLETMHHTYPEMKYFFRCVLVHCKLYLPYIEEL